MTAHTRRMIVEHTVHTPEPGTQPSLFDPYPARADMTIDERWECFKRSNPDIMRRLLALAHARRAEGRRRIATKDLFETLRAEGPATTDGNAPWRLDNRYTSRAADDLIALDPVLDAYIERRQRRAA